MGSIPFGYLLTKLFLKKDIRELIINTKNKKITTIMDDEKTKINYFYLELLHQIR